MTTHAPARLKESFFELAYTSPLSALLTLCSRVAEGLRWLMYRHPWWTRVVFVVFLWFTATILGAQQAMAADSSGSYGINVAGLKDSHGVPISSYVRLPIDRGDVWTGWKTVISIPTELLWAAHLFYVTWLISLVNYILSFDWVQIIAAPFNAIAIGLQDLIAAFNFIPFFLFVAALVTGVMMLKGKLATGMLEFALAVTLSILATGILSNPVALITGPEGAIAKAQQWGGEIAIAVTSTPITKPGESPPGRDGSLDLVGKQISAKDVLNDTISAELIDAFIRVPAQTIAFGHALNAKCGQVFDDQMKAKDPVKEETAVRDKVGECDPLAKMVVQNPSYMQPVSAAVVGSGAGILNLFTVVLAFFFIWSVISNLWNGLKLMLQVVKGILPAFARTGFWYGISGLGTSLLMFVFALLFLAGYLKFVVSALEMTSALGMVMQMTLINLLLITGLVMLFVIKRRAKKAGESLGKRLSRIGMNTKDKETRRNPVGAFAQAAAPFAPMLMGMKGKTKTPMANAPQRSIETPGLTDLGERFKARPSSAPALTSSPRLALTSFDAGPDVPQGPRPGPKGRPPKMGPISTPGAPGQGPKGEPENPLEVRRERNARWRSKIASTAATAASFIPGGGAVVAGAKVVTQAASVAADQKAAKASAERARSQTGNGARSSRIRVGENGRGSVDSPLEGKIVYTPGQEGPFPSTAQRPAGQRGRAFDTPPQRSQKPKGPSLEKQAADRARARARRTSQSIQIAQRLARARKGLK